MPSYRLEKTLLTLVALALVNLGSLSVYAEPLSNICLKTLASKLTEALQNQSTRYAKDTLLEPIYVQSNLYVPLRKLGVSSAYVYIAKAPTGEEVILKKVKPDSKHWFTSVEYEKAVTEYYAELREKDPDFPYTAKTIAIDSTNGVIIKEYIPGIVGNELYRYYNKDPKEKEKLEAQLNRAGIKIEEAHSNEKFANWLNKKGIAYKHWPFGLVQYGDFKEANFVLSLKYGWTCIDP